MHPSLLQALLHHPKHQPLIQKHLLRAAKIPKEIIRLAYAGANHINLAPWTLPSDMIIQVAQLDDLRGATALSICADSLDNISALIQMLSRHKEIQHIYFLQAPNRANDEATVKLFTEICQSSPDLLTRNIKFSCAFSSPFHQRFWLPRNTLQLDIFPVQYKFVRKQVTAGSRPAFHPHHYFLGDALLSPERVVTDLLEYCPRAVKDRYLTSFASASLDLKTYIHGSAHAITPVPAENFSIPERVGELECWPVVRELTPGSWVLLVSQEWHISPDDPSASADYVVSGLPFIRYAFAQARPDLPVARRIGTDEVRIVGGALEFLAATTSVNERLVKKAMDIVEGRMAAQPWRKLGVGMRYVDVLQDAEARQMLEAFWEDARFVKGNLREAMRADAGKCIEF